MVVDGGHHRPSARSLLGPRSGEHPLAEGLAKVYFAAGRGWVDGPEGLLVWCADLRSGFQYLKLFGLEDGALLVEGKLYEGFATHYRCHRQHEQHFHTMEFEDAVVEVSRCCSGPEFSAARMADGHKLPMKAPDRSRGMPIGRPLKPRGGAGDLKLLRPLTAVVWTESI